MNQILKYLKINTKFTLFIFFLSYLVTIKSRLLHNELSLLTFTPEGPIATFISAFIIFYIIKMLTDKVTKIHNHQSNDSQKYIRAFFTSMILFLVILNSLSFLIAAAFDNIERNFNSMTLLKVNLNNIVDFILFGGIYISYQILTELIDKRKLIHDYDRVLSDSKIQQLKAQLDPHFLFNSLNTLDQFIEEDKDKASDYLNHFADLYRYSLLTTDKKLVSLEDELTFVKSYFQLMEHKYSNCYQLHINYVSQNNMALNPHDAFIPPFTLQLLVENSIEHNLGTIEQPVIIIITIDKSISVENNKVVKQSHKSTNGRALKNLEAQFRILAKKPIFIEQDESYFRVTLPILDSNNA